MTTKTIKLKFDYIEEEIIIDLLCPKCFKFLKQGSVRVGLFEIIMFKGWTCKIHGEIKPNYTYKNETT